MVSSVTSYAIIVEVTGRARLKETVQAVVNLGTTPQSVIRSAHLDALIAKGAALQIATLLQANAHMDVKMGTMVTRV